MSAITLVAMGRRQPHRPFDLIDILYVIGEPAEASEWLCSGVECEGAGAERLHKLADQNQHISGSMLVQIAADVTCTIEGYFRAFQSSDGSPWLVIRAVDGTEFDVESRDEGIIAVLKQHFPDVRDFPADGGSYF